MGSLDFLIRPADVTDASQIHDLHKRSVRRLCAKSYSPSQIDGWLNDRSPGGYVQSIVRGEMFVAEQDGRLIGFVHALPGRIIALFVDPDFIGRGIGSALLQEGVELALKANHGKVTLESTLNATTFYERFGFREVARKTAQGNSTNLLVAVMELTQ
jgi:predicted N-acetyltransferase YhbS